MRRSQESKWPGPGVQNLKGSNMGRQDWASLNPTFPARRRPLSYASRNALGLLSGTKGAKVRIHRRKGKLGSPDVIPLVRAWLAS